MKVVSRVGYKHLQPIDKQRYDFNTTGSLQDYKNKAFWG